MDARSRNLTAAGNDLTRGAFHLASGGAFYRTNRGFHLTNCGLALAVFEIRRASFVPVGCFREVERESLLYQTPLDEKQSSKNVCERAGA